MNDNRNSERTQFIEQIWQSYIKACYGDGLAADSVQYQEIRRGFYSGCVAAQRLLRMTEELGHPVQIGLDMLQDECADFVVEVLQGRK
ncbi:hypothetical protein ACC806_34460 [Rhizobium ruizarguesonis]